MVINGKKIAEEILKELALEINNKKITSKLAAILVGDNNSSKKFLNLKRDAAKKAGIDFELFEFPEEISEEELIGQVKKITEKDNITGLLIELPLPEKFEKQKILNAIPAGKDADILSQEVQDKFYSGPPVGGLLPPAVEAVKIIFEKYGINPENKKVAVFGQGLLVGKPISFWLSKMGAEVFRIDEFTKNPEIYSGQAEIIISGAGKPGLISADMVKEGVIAIDFGYGRKGGKMMGDIEFESVSEKASLITPVPGGVGPIVVSAVLKNVVALAKFKTKNPAHIRARG